MGFPHLKYPLVLGLDVAGVIVEVGNSVITFKVGDRVLGECLGTDKEHVSNQNGEAGFQEYVVLQAHMSSKVPDALSFEQACVLPLGLSTAACGLFEKDYLGLELPQPGQAITRNDTVLIWGGSTSVGTNAIQLAVASGYEVITTCSPKNFEYCRALGAKHCFDYRSHIVVQDIVSCLQGKVCAGALAIGTNSHTACMSITSRHKFESKEGRSGRKFVCVASAPEFIEPGQSLAFIRTIARFVGFGAGLVWTAWRHGIGWKFVQGTKSSATEVGPAIYNSFLPAALESGQFRALPEAEVIGHGLDKVQEAMDVLKKGVSAKKVVVTLG